MNRKKYVKATKTELLCLFRHEEQQYLHSKKAIARNGEEQTFLNFSDTPL